MKTDMYLNLCLEQAAHSTLRHRHGCIVVKGGKVIGQGFNDFRSGYDGGALKTGRIAAGGRHLKAPSPPDTSPEQDMSNDLESIGGVVAGTHISSQSLSMHSEMMAIHSALTSSGSAPARSTKTLLRIPRDSKRNRGLRRETIHSPPALSGVLNLASGKAQQQGQNRMKEADHYHHGQKVYQQSYIGGKKKHKKAASKSALRAQSSESPPKVKSDGEDDRNDLNASKSRHDHTEAPGKSQTCKDAQPSINVIDRRKCSKLYGADIYVARLSRYDNLQPGKCKGTRRTTSRSVSVESSLLPSLPQAGKMSGSLHEELACRDKPTPPRSHANKETKPCVSAVESRPCYRCILYMHSVGIKRVFWTDNNGRWQVSKVRELVEALDKGDLPSPTDPSSRLFVTKYEVLLWYRSRQKLEPGASNVAGPGGKIQKVPGERPTLRKGQV